MHSYIAILWSMAVLPFASIAAAEAPLRINLVAGFTRIIEVPFDIGPISIDKPHHLNYHRFSKGPDERKLILIAGKAGTSEMRIRDPQSKAELVLTIETITDADGIRAAIPELKREAAARGEEVRELQMESGKSEHLSVPFEIGPIFLTDSTRVNFFRTGGDKKLTLVARNPGVTDLALHDAEGTRRIFLVITVSAAR